MTAGAEAAAIREGPQPKHLQLTSLLTALASERLSPGAAIPSERELMATYAVSRATVRRSIESLVGDGLLERVHGKGTFVARPRLESRPHLLSFTEDMRRRGLTPSTRLLALEVARPPADVATALGLRRGSRAWRLERVRLADGRALALQEGWYPRAPLPDLDRRDLSGSLYELFARDYGLVIASAAQTLWGESADGPTARLLDAELHTPLLVLRRVSSTGDRAVEHTVSRYRGDRYQIHMNLGADEVAGRQHHRARTTGRAHP